MKVKLVPLESTTDDQEVLLKDRVTVVGREAGCGLRIEDATISRQHCELTLSEGRLVARDLDSANGTRVNGIPIGEAELRDGDRLSVGRRHFAVLITEAAQDADKNDAGKDEPGNDRPQGQDEQPDRDDLDDPEAGDIDTIDAEIGMALEESPALRGETGAEKHPAGWHGDTSSDRHDEEPAPRGDPADGVATPPAEETPADALATPPAEETPADGLATPPEPTAHPVKAIKLPAGQPLHEGARLGDRGLVSLFVTKGADIDGRGGPYAATPLHYACGGGHLLVVELLIARGADVNATDDRGATPLHWARLLGRQDVADALLAAGAEDTPAEDPEPE